MLSVIEQIQLSGKKHNNNSNKTAIPKWFWAEIQSPSVFVKLLYAFMGMQQTNG